METLVTIGYIIICVLFFSLAVAIHEFGHFIVALKLGLNVERFSIGFGPALWKKTWRGVEYRISAIPLGGYVSIPDVDPEGTKALEGEKKAADAETRARIPAWKELAVAVAGPMMNIVLAVVLAFLLAAIPGAKFGEIPLDIEQVLEDHAAARAGIENGDRIVKINGHPVRSKYDMQVELVIAGKDTASMVEVMRGGTNVVVEVMPDFIDNPSGVAIPMLGVLLHAPEQVTTTPWMSRRNPIDQLAWDAGSIFRMLKGLVTPKEAATTAKSLGGPVMIAESIYASTRKDFWDGVGFLRFLNVNLAVVNLLPIPVLDGGLILFALIALIFRRRVPDKIVNALSTGFMYLLLALMALLIYRDSVRSYRLHTSASDEAEEAVGNREEAIGGEAIGNGEEAIVDEAIGNREEAIGEEKGDAAADAAVEDR